LILTRRTCSQVISQIREDNAGALCAPVAILITSPICKYAALASTAIFTSSPQYAGITPSNMNSNVLPLCATVRAPAPLTSTACADAWSDRYGAEPRKGSDIVVQALEREGVDTVFAYPGGASMEIHQALTRSPTIRNILCRHEQVRPHSVRTVRVGRVLDNLQSSVHV
jgi:hypothetical protein